MTDESFLAILDLARFAPSVHNTQPWSVQKTDQNEIILTLDPAYVLRDGDPSGRQTIISLGIFSQAVCLAAAEFGYGTSVHFENQIVKISFKKSSSSPKVSEDITALQKRCSDRSIYAKVPIKESVTESIENTSKAHGIHISVVTEPDALATIARLTSQGIHLALSNPRFRNELSQYLREPWSSKKRGIAIKSLYLPLPLAVLQPVLIRLGWGLKREADLEKRRWLSASAVVVISADGDMPPFWFEVGRTYLRVSLEIEKAGLSQATSAAIVEASTFHEDIEALLGTSHRIQAILRVGKGHAKRHYSPRIDPQDLLKAT